MDHLVMSMCRVFTCVVGRGCLLWPVHSLGKTHWLDGHEFEQAPGFGFGYCLHLKAIKLLVSETVSIHIGRTDAEAEVPKLWPPDAKSQLIRKDPDVGQDWSQEEKRMTEVEMVGWHHWLDGHEFEQALGVGDGQGSLACCSPWGHKESDTTEWLSWT